MSLFKRLSTTFVARIDQVVGEIENHDAVIQAALTDMRKKIAEARVHLSQVQREAERLRREMEEQRQTADRWRQRAVASASTDEGKALECLSRAKQCDQQVARLQAALAQFEQSGERLGQDIEASEQRLRDLKQKHTLMRARQSSSAASSATQETEADVLRQLDDSFDRWEIKIGQIELAIDQPEPADRLERDFLSRERERELRDELAQLLGKENKQ